MMERVKVDDCQKLQIHICVLGYYPEGESILIVLYDEAKNEPIQTILTDSYEKGGVNLLDRTFSAYNLDVKKLDYVIWTHPDHDHSVGFAHIVKKYVSKKTTFIMPEGLNIWETLGNWDTFMSWWAIAKNKVIGKKNIERVNSSNRRTYPLMYSISLFDGMSESNIVFSLEILTPFADQIFRHFEHNKTHKGNHMSISFVVRLGDLGFYFGGDVENMAIKNIDTDKLSNLYFVKVPHHASNTSGELPAILHKIKPDGEKPKILSVSTGFHIGKSDLPMQVVLDQYKNCSFKILVTEDCTHQQGYGIWDCRFNLMSSNPWIMKSSGDSTVYYECTRDPI